MTKSLEAEMGQQARPAESENTSTYVVAGILTIAGLVALLAGLYFVWPPLAAIVGGLLLLALAVVVVRVT